LYQIDEKEILAGYDKTMSEVDSLTRHFAWARRKGLGQDVMEIIHDHAAGCHPSVLASAPPW
jgi:hypothetical protein